MELEGEGEGNIRTKGGKRETVKQKDGFYLREPFFVLQQADFKKLVFRSRH